MQRHNAVQLSQERPKTEFSEKPKIWLDKFRKMKYNNSRKSRHATVAQLVEQLIRNQQVEVDCKARKPA